MTPRTRPTSRPSRVAATVSSRRSRRWCRRKPRRLRPSTAGAADAGSSGNRGARLYERQHRSRVCVAVVWHCRNRHQRSPRGRHPPDHRPPARRRSRAEGGCRPRGVAQGVASRSGRRRELSASRRSAAGLPRVSWTRERAKRSPKRRPMGRSSRSSNCRTVSWRNSAETLGSAQADALAARRSYRETSSLEAYQAFTEGRVRLESLDASFGRRRGRRFRTRDCPRPALCARPCRAGQCALLAIRDVACAQSARCGRCWRAPSITCDGQSSSSGILPKRTRRSRSCL